jgi:hypothetical protein
MSRLRWPKHLDRVFARAGSILLENHAYGHKEFVHCLAPWHNALCMHLQWCLPTSVADIPTWGLCLFSMWSAYNIGVYYHSGEGGVAKLFVVVGRQGWQGLPRAFQKLSPMSSTHWGYSSSWTGRRARGSSMFLCVKKKWLLCLMWSVSTWLAHGMLEATLEISTI